jgi:hypothetical protein
VTSRARPLPCDAQTLFLARGENTVEAVGMVVAAGGHVHPLVAHGRLDPEASGGHGGQGFASATTLASPPQHPYTLCVRQSAEESGDDRPTGFQKVSGMPNSPGRGGPVDRE